MCALPVFHSLLLVVLVGWVGLLFVVSVIIVVVVVVIVGQSCSVLAMVVPFFGLLVHFFVWPAVTLCSNTPMQSTGMLSCVCVCCAVGCGWSVHVFLCVCVFVCGLKPCH